MGEGFDVALLKSSWDECCAKERQRLKENWVESSSDYACRFLQDTMGMGPRAWRYATAILPPARVHYRVAEQRLVFNVQGQPALFTSDGLKPEAFLDRVTTWVNRQINIFAALDDLGRVRLILRRVGIKIDLSGRGQTWIPQHDFWVVPRSTDFAALVGTLLDAYPDLGSWLPHLLWLKTGVMKQAAHLLKIRQGYRLFAKVELQPIAQAIRLAPTPILLAKYARHNGVVDGQSFTYPVSRSWWLSSAGLDLPLKIELRPCQSWVGSNGVHTQGYLVEIHDLAYDYNHPQAKQIREHNRGLAKDDPDRLPETFSHRFWYSA